jgi:hypothetical protein
MRIVEAASLQLEGLMATPILGQNPVDSSNAQHIQCWLSSVLHVANATVIPILLVSATYHIAQQNTSAATALYTQAMLL